AVEAVERGEEAAATGLARGELERAFVRLGAARGEERAVDLAGREAREALGQVELRPGVDQVGGLHQSARLVGDRLGQRRVAMADRGPAPAGGQVDELAAVDVPHTRALAALEGDRPAPDGRHEHLLLATDELVELLGHLGSTSRYKNRTTRSRAWRC